MKPIRPNASRITAIALGLLAPALSSRMSDAGEAFFSADGKTVTMVHSRSSSSLFRIDLATGQLTTAAMPDDLIEEYIESVASGAEGEALFLAKEAVWVWTPGPDGKVKRVCSTAPVKASMDLFVMSKPGTPLNDAIFLSGLTEEEVAGIGTFYGRLPGKESVFSPVFCRRVANAMSGVCTPDGRLFFVSDGDLWEGGILAEEDATMGRLGVLIGARIAPLAISNTDEANGGGLWVSSIAPAGRWIYAHLRGRHMSTIVRMPMPEKPLYSPDTEEFPTVKQQLDAMRDALTGTEIIADDLGDIFGFCATETGGVTRLFYTTLTDAEGKGPAMMLREGDGETRVIGYLPAD